jgi:hypothetical protein
MPIPLIPIVIGTAGAALLFAGKKPSAPVAPSAGGVATPTTQSTGGTSGGAQSPSHADMEQVTDTGGGEMNLQVGGESASVLAGELTAPEPMLAPAPAPVVLNEDGYRIRGSDPAPTPTPVEPVLATIFTPVATAGAKAISDSFSSFGPLVGLVW